MRVNQKSRDVVATENTFTGGLQIGQVVVVVVENAVCVCIENVCECE